MGNRNKGYTLKQWAYAKKMLGSQGQSKKQIALSLGYSPSSADNVKHVIEDTPGFQLAMREIAMEAGHMVMAVMAEYKARGLDGFSNRDLNGAMNAIANAFDKLGTGTGLLKNKNETPENRLRAVLLQNVQSQTVTVNQPEKEEEKK